MTGWTIGRKEIPEKESYCLPWKRERERILHNHCCENLKSYKCFSVFEAF
jgi:hypothetical protein